VCVFGIFFMDFIDCEHTGTVKYFNL
jgi:hypothetical protein